MTSFVEKHFHVHANLKKFNKINLFEKQFPQKLMSFHILILSFGAINNLLRLLRS